MFCMVVFASLFIAVTNKRTQTVKDEEEEKIVDIFEFIFLFASIFISISLFFFIASLYFFFGLSLSLCQLVSLPVSPSLWDIQSLSLLLLPFPFSKPSFPSQSVAFLTIADLYVQ